jgi:hypothetical protein
LVRSEYVYVDPVDVEVAELDVEVVVESPTVGDVVDVEVAELDVEVVVESPTVGDVVDVEVAKLDVEVVVEIPTVGDGDEVVVKSPTVEDVAKDDDEDDELPTQPLLPQVCPAGQTSGQRSPTEH